MEENPEAISTELLKKIGEVITKKCLAEIGILIMPSVSFQSEANLKRLQLKSGAFSVRLKGYNDSINLEYDIEAWPDEANLSKALFTMPVIVDLNNNIKEVIIRELWNKVSINQFCLALNLTNEDFEILSGEGSVRDILIEPVNAVLAQSGRKAGHFELTSSSIENIKPKDLLDIENFYSYKIADEKETVGVKSRVSLRLVNIANFKSADEKYKIRKNATPVEEWFKQVIITPLIKDILFDKTYKYILLHPDSIKEEIEESISKKANEMGYAVRQHTHLPDIKKLRLREGFSIVAQDEEFETRSSDVKIKLNITVKGKINDFEELDERLLLPAIDIEAEMKSEIRSVMEDVIHSMDPEQIYLRFSYTGDKQNPPVDEILANCIEECLDEKFKVDTKSLKSIIKLSQSEDEFIKKTKELRKEVRKFSVTIYPVSKDSYVEPLTYEIQYRILGIDEQGWSVFLSRISKDVLNQFEELESFLTALITEKLNSVDYAILKSEDIVVKKKLKEGISQYTSDEVSTKFGLLIGFSTFLRIRSETEMRSIKTSLETFRLEEESVIEDKKKEIENLHEKIRVLREQEMEAIKREDLESAEIFKEHIEKLKKSSTEIIPEVGNIRKQIELSKNDNDILNSLFNDSSKRIENRQDKKEDKDE
ncbi:MAG: hypothetical protein QM737_16720 [Ferruginibacter sp.]